MIPMKLWKRITAAVTTLCMMLTCFACGEDTGIAMTIDGVDVRAGIYLYYVVNAYNDAISVAQERRSRPSPTAKPPRMSRRS